MRGRLAGFRGRRLPHRKAGRRGARRRHHLCPEPGGAAQGGGRRRRYDRQHRGPVLDPAARPRAGRHRPDRNPGGPARLSRALADRARGAGATTLVAGGRCAVSGKARLHRRQQPGPLSLRSELDRPPAEPAAQRAGPGARLAAGLSAAARGSVGDAQRRLRDNSAGHPESHGGACETGPQRRSDPHHRRAGRASAQGGRLLRHIPARRPRALLRRARRRPGDHGRGDLGERGHAVCRRPDRRRPGEGAHPDRRRPPLRTPVAARWPPGCGRSSARRPSPGSRPAILPGGRREGGGRDDPSVAPTIGHGRRGPGGRRGGAAPRPGAGPASRPARSSSAS